MKFILEVDVIQGMTFEDIARILREEADKLPKHPLGRDTPSIGDGGSVHTPDGKTPVCWYTE